MIGAVWSAFTALPRGWHYLAGAIAAFALLGALWLYLSNREEADDRRNQDIGGAVQREGDLRETLDRTETGNETRDQVKRELDNGRSDGLYARCLRTARTPANCERFLPEREADDR